MSEMTRGTMAAAARHAAVLALALATGWAIGTGRAEGVALAAGVAIAAASLLWPEIGVYAIIGTYFLADRFAGLGMLPNAARWVPDLVILGFAIRVMAERIPLSRARPAFRVVGPWIGLLIAWCFVSGMGNGFGAGEYVVGFRYYAKFPALMLLLVMLDYPMRMYRRAFKVIFVLTLVQLPVTAFQYYSTGVAGDLNSGTLLLHGGGDLLFLCAGAMAVLLAYALRSRGHAVWAGVAAFAMVLPPMFARARFVVFVVPVVIAAVVGRAAFASQRGAARRIALVSAMLAGVVLLVSTSTAVSRLVTANVFESLDAARAYEDVVGASSFGRISAMRAARDLVGSSPSVATFGFGPGTTGESVVAVGRLQTNSIGLLVRNQVIATTLELGYPGLLFMLAGCAWLWWRSSRFRGAPDEGGLIASIRFAAPAVIFTYAILLLYGRVWFSDVPSFLVWFGLAALTKGDSLCDVHES